MAEGGATWDAAGLLQLGSGNGFDLSAVTEVGASSPFNHAYWRVTIPTAGELVTITCTPEVSDPDAYSDPLLAVYRGGTSTGDAELLAGGVSSVVFAPDAGDVITLLAGTPDIGGDFVTRYIINVEAHTTEIHSETLIAHNVTADGTGTDPRALESSGDGKTVTLASTEAAYVGSSTFGAGGGDVLGMGTVVLPDGATPLDAVWHATAVDAPCDVSIIYFGQFDPDHPEILTFSSTGGTELEAVVDVQRQPFVFGEGGVDPDLGMGPELLALGSDESVTLDALWIVATYSLDIPAVWDVVSPGFLPPLRQHPRDDGYGASTTPRLYPPPRSVQVSLRRAGGYL